MTDNLTSQKLMDLNNKTEKKRNNQFLRPPTPTKQFLISPPASPPVGWVPCEEATPILNYDLIHAINRLAPGEAHELHPPSDEHPAIVVHICEDDDNLNVNKKNIPTIIQSDESEDSENEHDLKQSKIKIQKTRAPDSFLKGKDGLRNDFNE